MYAKYISGSSTEIEITQDQNGRFKFAVGEPKSLEILFASDSKLNIPKIAVNELKALIESEDQEAVFYIYCPGQTYNKSDRMDPVVFGDNAMQEMMELFGPAVKYYKIDITEYKQTNLVEEIKKHIKPELVFPVFYVNIGMPLTHNWIGMVPPGQEKTKISKEDGFRQRKEIYDKMLKDSGKV